ncbi:MAG: DUF302 domain-containing protein [Halobacteriota archaeon]
MAAPVGPPDGIAPTVEEALYLALDEPFDDVVPFVQLEHEYVGFETVSLTRLDRMIEGVLEERYPATALLVTCHAEVARDALAIDPHLAGLLPCTTVIYERDDDPYAHVYHLSATKALRDLGVAGSTAPEAVERLVAKTGEYMSQVWENIRSNATVVSDAP